MLLCLAAGRVSLEDMFAEYLRLLPEYRSCNNLDGVSIKRAFFGFVPNWEDSPLKACTARLVHVGDASGNRSALSFAGTAVYGTKTVSDQGGAVYKALCSVVQVFMPSSVVCNGQAAL